MKKEKCLFTNMHTTNFLQRLFKRRLFSGPWFSGNRFSALFVYFQSEIYNIGNLDCPMNSSLKWEIFKELMKSWWSPNFLHFLVDTNFPVRNWWIVIGLKCTYCFRRIPQILDWIVAQIFHSVLKLWINIEELGNAYFLHFPFTSFFSSKKGHNENRHIIEK